MARNADGTVTVKTPGKVASNPSGSGTGQVKPAAAKGHTPGPRVVPQKGRSVVGKSQSGGGKGGGKK